MASGTTREHQRRKRGHIYPLSAGAPDTHHILVHWSNKDCRVQQRTQQSFTYCFLVPPVLAGHKLFSDPPVMVSCGECSGSSPWSGSETSLLGSCGECSDSSPWHRFESSKGWGLFGRNVSSVIVTPSTSPGLPPPLHGNTAMSHSNVTNATMLYPPVTMPETMSPDKPFCPGIVSARQVWYHKTQKQRV